jgi:hypothetical protein
MRRYGNMLCKAREVGGEAGILIGRRRQVSSTSIGRMGAQMERGWWIMTQHGWSVKRVQRRDEKGRIMCESSNVGKSA